MVRIMLLLTLGYSTLSFSSSAQTYCPLSSNGKTVKPPMGFTLVPVTSSKTQDVYHLKPTDENPYGGNSQIWVAYKDSHGRVVKIESGGEKPSQKLVNYELKKREYELKNHIPSEATEERRYTVPGIKEAKMALAQPEDFPIKFGASIEMNFSGTECEVSKLSERYFDPKGKSNLDKVVFNSNKCDSVRNLYSKYEKDITTCTEKLVSHESEIVRLLNVEDGADIQKLIPGGAGGGGGAPIRSIASLRDSSKPFPRGPVVSMENYLRSGAGGLGSGLLKEREFCNILAPASSGTSTTEAIPYPGKASHQ